MSEAEDSGNGAKKIKDVTSMAAYNWEIQQERGWHKAAALLFALGTSGSQIARELDKTPQAVCNLVKQRFFQERVAEIQAENRRDFMDLFKAERINTLATLIAIRDNPNTPASVKAMVCKDLLDRSLGKAVQHVEVSAETHSDDPVREYEACG